MQPLMSPLTILWVYLTISIYGHLGSHQTSVCKRDTSADSIILTMEQWGYCYFALDPKVYWIEIHSPSDDAERPYRLDMLKVRKLCARWNASVLRSDFNESEWRMNIFEKFLIGLEELGEGEQGYGYPIDCAFKRDDDFPPCDQGQLPDDYEWYLIYHFRLNSKQIYMDERAKPFTKEEFKTKFMIICQTTKSAAAPACCHCGIVDPQDVWVYDRFDDDVEDLLLSNRSGLHV